MPTPFRRTIYGEYTERTDNIATLDNGADINAEGEEYGNALQVASSQGDMAVVQLLREHGNFQETQDL
jgi:hypothetical protein